MTDVLVTILCGHHFLLVITETGSDLLLPSAVVNGY